MTDSSIDFLTGFCEVLDHLSNGDLNKAETLLDKLIVDQDSPYCNVREKLNNFISQLHEGSKFVNTLSEGDLKYEAPRNFYLFSEYKQLQANLRHLTWQTQQIAKGDYNQSVNFMGEFSTAFNQMTVGLREAKKTQDQLRDLYATRDKFFSIISHDLRSPFNAILGFSDILTEEWDELSEEDRKNFLKNIRNTAHNTFDLLERLLAWSRIQTGKMRFTPSLLNINSIVQENIRLLSSSADCKFIRINSEVSDESIAWGDKDAILLVLRNLLNNAIKFTRHGGVITISAAPMHKLVVVTVSDTGVGISAENIKKIFTFEEQLKTEGTDKEKGCGLGLVLCKEIIERSGGRIWAESSEGDGSRFSFSLPINKPTPDIS